MNQFLDRLMGYIIVPLTLLFGARVNGAAAIGAALRRARDTAHEAYLNTRALLVRLLAPYVVALLVASAGFMGVLLMAAYFFAANTNGTKWAFVAAGIGVLALLWQAHRQLPAIERVIGLDPETDEPIVAPGFRPGRLNVTLSTVLTTLAWLLFAVCMLIVSAVEEQLFFLPFVVIGGFMAWATGRLYVAVLGKVLELAGDTMEGLFNFTVDQLAVLAPGIQWSNLRQHVRPKDLFDQAFPRLAGRSVSDAIFANILLTVLVLSILSPTVGHLIGTVATIGMIQVGMSLGMLLGAKYAVEAMRARFGLVVVGSVSMIALIVNSWRYLAADSFKETVLGYWDGLAGFFYGQHGPHAGTWWQNVLLIGSALAFAGIAAAIHKAVLPDDDSEEKREARGAGRNAFGLLLGFIAFVCVLLAFAGGARLIANIVGGEKYEKITLPVRVEPAMVSHGRVQPPKAEEPKVVVVTPRVTVQTATAPKKQVAKKKVAKKVNKKTVAERTGVLDSSDDIWDPQFRALYSSQQ